MNEDLVEHWLNTHDNRLNNHSDRIDKLEQSSFFYSNRKFM